MVFSARLVLNSAGNALNFFSLLVFSVDFLPLGKGIQNYFQSSSNPFHDGLQFIHLVVEFHHILFDDHQARN